MTSTMLGFSLSGILGSYLRRGAMYEEYRQEASFKVSTMDEKEAQRLSKHQMLLRRVESVQHA